jgi:hypothetical protein
MALRDRRRDAKPRIEPVQHGIGARQPPASLAAQQRALANGTVWPRAVGDIEASVLEHGEVGDRHRRMAVLDDHPGRPPAR